MKFAPGIYVCLALFGLTYALKSTDSESDLLRKCSTKPARNHTAVDLCKMILSIWMYDPRDHHCKFYVYIGCGTNHNGFVRRKDCLKACKYP